MTALSSASRRSWMKRTPLYRRAFVLPSTALAIALLAGCPSDPDATSQPVSNDPSKLIAPAPGEGFQFRTSLFQVNPGEEVQDCYFFKVRDLAKTGGLSENEPVNL